jgi:hypothetical protein
MATRRERVILDLEDNFSSGMARAAASAALLDKSLGSLSGSAVESRRNLGDLNDKELSKLGRNSESTGRQIDRLSGRLQLIAQAAAVLGPALVPIGAAAVPGIAAMATQMTVAAAAAGAAVIAFKGLGDGLKALNEYQLDPSADNFAKLQEEMHKLGPAGADFVRFLDSIGPQLKGLQFTAREGMFPGVEDGITSLLDLLPQLDRIIGDVSGAMGQLAREAGAGLSGEGFTSFFEYLDNEAGPILLEMGRTVGNFAEGLANLLVGFGPLTTQFSGGLLEMSRSFAQWSRGLEENDSFQSFLDYAADAGPKVLDFFGSLVDALVGIAKAAAPVGDVVLPVLTKLLDGVAAVADSDVGTHLIAIAAALSAYSRAAGLAGAASQRLGIQGATGISRFSAAASKLSGHLTQGAAGAGAFALSMTDVDEKAGISNTAMGALMGTMLLPGWGTAAGAIVGGFMDIQDAAQETTDKIDAAYDAVRSRELGALFDQRRAIQAELNDDFLGVFDNPRTFELENALGAINDAIAGVKGHAGGLGDLLSGPLSDAFQEGADAARDFQKAVNSAFALLDKRAALRAARQAVRDFNEAMGDAPKKMEKGGPAYDKVEEALDGIARSSLEAGEHLRGMARVNFIARQREQFIDAARQMGITRDRARGLADELGLLSKKKAVAKIEGDNKDAKKKLEQAEDWLFKWGRENESATVDANNKPAKGKVDEATHWLSIIGGSKAIAEIHVNSDAATIAAQTASILNSISDEIVYIHTVRTGRGGQGAGYDGAADGGTIRGQRHPYGDKVPTLLAPGEEVISNRYGQADRHRELLKAINANRYASGGTVSAPLAPRAYHSTTSRSFERVVERMPGQVVLTIPGMGRLLAHVADSRIAADRTYRDRLDDRD